MEFVSDSGDALDPRIQIELENLNNATEDINKLESELDEANSLFKKLHSELTGQLGEIADKIGSSCVEKARCYYEALEDARRSQVQCQQQAQLFQRASEFHAEAKKKAASAETRCLSNTHERILDQAWQDKLNHATTMVMHAANQKAECEKEHLRRALIFYNAETKAQQLEKKYHRAIIKARPYFEVRTICDEKLSMQKQQVECLQKAVRDAKRNYSKSFRTLEDISNQIHEQRRVYVNGPREPGVGAELLAPDRNLNYEAELTMGVQELIPAPAHRLENINNRLVDGSETSLTQWEIEFQTNEKKLNVLKTSEEIDNQLSVENPSSTTRHQWEESSSISTVDSCDEQEIECQTQMKDLENQEIDKPSWRASTESPVNSISYNANIISKRVLSKSLSDIPLDVSLEIDTQKQIKSNKTASQDY